MKIPLIIGALGLAAVSSAITGVVPNAFAATEASGTFSLTTNTAGGRTFQLVIDSTQLTSFVNTNINGMALRLNAGATWPAIPVNMSFFDVYMGAGVDPTLTSTTFASNFTGSVMQVRSGALSYNPGDFGTGGSPNTFGPDITFNMGPYLYTGGDLAIMMRFATQTGTGGTPTQAAFDAVLATDTASGYGTSFAARWASGSSATVGNNANFLVSRLNASPVPEPATMAALGLGAAALIRRRRK